MDADLILGSNVDSALDAINNRYENGLVSAILFGDPPQVTATATGYTSRPRNRSFLGVSLLKEI